MTTTTAKKPTRRARTAPLKAAATQRVVAAAQRSRTYLWIAGGIAGTLLIAALSPRVRAQGGALLLAASALLAQAATSPQVHGVLERAKRGAAQLIS